MNPTFPRRARLLALLALVLFLAGCGAEGAGDAARSGRGDAAAGDGVSSGDRAGAASETDRAASEAAAAGTPPVAREEPRSGAASPRHGEYVMYATAGGDSVRAFLVYPERPDDAPGLVVIHEIFGLTDWIRDVADRYAAEGFVAIAPDLLWGKAPGGGGTDAYPDGDAVVAAIRELPPHEVKARLDGAGAFLRSLPASNGRVGVVGFCWGGQQSFQYAAEQPRLSAAVVFYGSGPEPLSKLEDIRAPVLGLYGGDDQRVNATIPAIDSAMAAAGKRYDKEIYPGAGHGFLREDEAGANARAAAAAWPRSVAFLREALEGG